MKESDHTLKERKFDDKTKDRGDNFKKLDKSKEKGVLKTVRKSNLADRGDTSSKGSKALKNSKIIHKPFDRRSKIHDTEPIAKHPNVIDRKKSYTIMSIANNKASEANDLPLASIGDSKAVSDRARSINNQSLISDKNSTRSEVKNDRIKTKPSFKSGSREKVFDSNKSDLNTESDFQTKSFKNAAQKKPMIKTVKSKNDKVYKAVTFTEREKIKPTLLEINIPNIQPKKTKIKLVDKNLEAKIISTEINRSISKLSAKEKQYSRRHRLTERIKRKRLNKSISSPDKFKKIESPPTEVAKWEPSCINEHTKPYYEAWINTTLAAISNMSKTDKLFLEKQNIIKNFQKSLELGSQSPELVHEDYSKEVNTGKIKIRRRKTSKRQPLITPLLDK